MLVRVEGRTDGVREYLEGGRKAGREYTRDEMDERLTLAGDLAVTDALIQSIDSEGERYLSVTLSFKEDEVSEATLRAIVDDFRKFTGAAYRDDELQLYAEAHLPRLKGYIHAATGEHIERKPHVHIVIPRTNLTSGTSLDPLGRVEHQIKFLDAWQEHINNKFGLASPKDNRRGYFTGEGETISRYKGDIFAGANRELREQLLAEILDRDITSYEAFAALVGERGAVRERNAGKENAYLNVRPEGAAKGVNLKEFVFSREFLALPKAAKIAAINASLESKFETAGAARRDPAHIAETLREWHEIRAREVKYINSGDRKLYARYRAAARDERVQILDELEKRFYARAETKQRQIEQRAADDMARAAQRIIEHPSDVLDALTKTQSTFRWQDVERYLIRHVPPEYFEAAYEAVMSAPQLVRLESDAGERFTTHAVAEIESRLLARVERLAADRREAVAQVHCDAAAASRDFNNGQKEAFALLTSGARIAVVNGAAGTGKSYVLRAMREAYEADGYELHGAILQGKTAEDLERDSGIKSSTLHSFLRAVDKGRVRLHEKSVVVVDEAGMVGSRQMEELIAHAERAGARVRLIGDAWQLPAVEFGGAFRAVSERVDTAALTEIMRQRAGGEWMCRASEALSRHEVKAGLDAYQARGFVHELDNRAAAREALVAKWIAERQENPERGQAVIVHTNAERRELNRLIREELLRAGELTDEAVFKTANGSLRLALRERIMFTQNSYSEDLDVRNGSAGEIESINGDVLDVALDDGRRVKVDLNTYDSIDHGWLLTVHKSQGIGEAKTYILPEPTMTAALAYVAMTRHKESMEVFYGRDDFASYGALVKALSRVDEKHFSQDERAARDIDSVVAHMLRDAKDRAAKHVDEATTEWRQINRTLDAHRLLAHLSRTHGLNPEKYAVVRHGDGSDRIQVGQRNMTASDFVTQHMHLRWTEDAQPLLRECYAQQLAEQPARAMEPRQGSLWAEFQRWRAGEWPAEKAAAWEAQKAIERVRRLEIRQTAEAAKRDLEAGDPRKYAQRRAALSVIRMQRIQREKQARGQTALERAALKARVNVRVSDLYRVWLAREAEKGDVQALAELRRRRVEPIKSPQGEHIADGDKDAKNRWGEDVFSGRLAYTVAANGDVTYQMDGRDVLRDEIRSVRVLESQDREVIETSIRLAMQKFGPVIDARGDEAFRQRVAQVAVEAGINVQFKDKAMNIYRDQLEKAKAAEQQTTREAQKEKKMETAAARPQAAERKAEEARLYEGALQRAKAADLPVWLQAHGVELKKNGLNGWKYSHGKGDNDLLFKSSRDGAWLVKTTHGERETLDAIGYVQMHTGMSHREAVEALSGMQLGLRARASQPAKATTPAPAPAATPAAPTILSIKEPTDVQRRAANEYARQRGISDETLREARRQGVLKANHRGVVFVGYDQQGQIRHAETRLLKPVEIGGELASKLSYNGADKTFPPVLRGDDKNLHFVEGGFDALALRDLAVRDGREPPTTIITGGARTLKWRDNEALRELIKNADSISAWSDNDHHLPPEKQAEVAAAHQKQYEALVEVRGSEEGIERLVPPAGVKDLAEMNALNKALVEAQQLAAIEAEKQASNLKA